MVFQLKYSFDTFPRAFSEFIACFYITKHHVRTEEVGCQRRKSNASGGTFELQFSVRLRSPADSLIFVHDLNERNEENFVSAFDMGRILFDSVHRGARDRLSGLIRYIDIIINKPKTEAMVTYDDSETSKLT